MGSLEKRNLAGKIYSLYKEIREIHLYDKHSTRNNNTCFSHFKYSAFATCMDKGNDMFTGDKNKPSQSVALLSLALPTDDHGRGNPALKLHWIAI
jgi:hypothetical protein